MTTDTSTRDSELRGATDSGLLLIPLMLGMVCASAVAGVLVSRTGRYRIFPVAGTILFTASILLLGTLDAASTRTESGMFMVVFGLGLGLTMQTIIIATQNEVAGADLGIATSAVKDLLTTGIALDPEHLELLPSGVRTRYIDDFAHALATTFWLVGPILAASVVLALALREAPLRDRPHEPTPGV